jgi:hypothetical protein
MENIEGMMRGLKLSEVERRGIRLRGNESEGSSEGEPQA